MSKKNRIEEMAASVWGAWREAVAYALAEDAGIGEEDMVTPGATEIYEVIDDVYPDCAPEERAEIARRVFRLIAA